MLGPVACVAVLLFSVVVSQPLFYWMALSRATRGLSALAYTELRQRINAAIVQRLTATYLASLIALLVLLGSALWTARLVLALGAGCATLALVADLVLAFKLNVPINKRMDAWNPHHAPSDWEEQRQAWDRALGLRSVVLLTGFAVLVGVVLLDPR